MPLRKSVAKIKQFPLIFTFSKIQAKHFASNFHFFQNSISKKGSLKISKPFLDQKNVR